MLVAADGVPQGLALSAGVSGLASSPALTLRPVREIELGAAAAP